MTENYKVIFSERLKELRKERGLTQEKLAREIGVARNTLTSYETNNSELDFETVFKIADFFNVSLDFLFGREKKTKFSKRLKELRTEHKLTQAAFSKKINLSSSSISMYENGFREPTLGTLRSLAEFFDVSMAYLSGKSDEIGVYTDILSEFENLVNGMDSGQYKASNRLKNIIEFEKYKKSNK